MSSRKSALEIVNLACNLPRKLPISSVRKFALINKYESIRNNQYIQNMREGLLEGDYILILFRSLRGCKPVFDLDHILNSTSAKYLQ